MTEKVKVVFTNEDATKNCTVDLTLVDGDVLQVKAAFNPEIKGESDEFYVNMAIVFLEALQK